jgi:peptide subunit release factor 1 (eRF1)
MNYVNPVRKILADANRAKAKIELTSKCLNCGHSYTHKLPWFERMDFRCPDCGGTIDQEPLRQMALSAAQGLKNTLSQLTNRSCS